MYRCPVCHVVVGPDDATCKNGHALTAQVTAAVPSATKDAAGPSSATGQQVSTATEVLETKIDYGVFLLYVLIVAILGAALLYSLSLGSTYQTFSSAIITALTTIAGFAVGANASSPSPKAQ